MARFTQIAAILAAATLSSARTPFIVERQVPADPTGVTTIKSAQGAEIRYKQPGKAGVCETTEGVDDYAGYISLNPTTNMFFWFFEARENPSEKPLTLWLNGGPGSDSLIGLFQEHGPCNVTEDLKTQLNPYSWNEHSNMLYLSQPVGVGFSYETTETDDEGRYSLVDPDTANTTDAAAIGAWHILQAFLDLSPQLDPDITNFTFNLWTERRQNEKIKNGSCAGVEIQMDTLGIINGIIDEQIQAPYYPEFAVNNTYGIKAVNDTIYSFMKNAYYMPEGCHDQIEYCKQSDRTTEDGYLTCSSATNLCRSLVEEPYYYFGGRGVYDIRHPYDDPTPPDYFEYFLNLASTQEAIGVNINYTSTNAPNVSLGFQQTGDFVFPNFLEDLEEILAYGVRVALLYGDADYICNWFGGEAVSLAVNFTDTEAFNAAGYTPFLVDGVEYGEVREYGNFSFTRIYEAGHEVPYYQPKASLEHFKRVLDKLVIADGSQVVTDDYSTNGTAEATHTESFVPLPSSTSSGLSRIRRGSEQEASTYRYSDDISTQGSQSESFHALLSPAESVRKHSRDNDPLFKPVNGKNQNRLPVKRRFPTGWRTGALASLVGAVSILIFNLIITIWVGSSPNLETDGAVGTLFMGSCTTVRRINIWIHLLVNVLAAPNRTEVDRAHAQRRWLHIGVPNLRNLWYIRKQRCVLYLALFLSSVPLHLLFNSVVFTRLQANEYFVVPTTESWINGGTYDTSNFQGFEKNWIEDFTSSAERYRIDLTDTIELRDGGTMPKYRNVSTRECFDSYNNHYVSNLGNVYLVQGQATFWRNWTLWELRQNKEDNHFEWVLKPENHTEEVDSRGDYGTNGWNTQMPVIADPEKYPSNGWRCPTHPVGECDPSNGTQIPQDRSQWKPWESDLNYCLIETVEEICELQFSFVIAAIVIVANLIKAVAMGLTYYKCKDHAAIVTIGDAIASFLDDPDPTTADRCLQTRRHVELWWDWNEWEKERPIIAQQRDRRRFRPRRRKWAMAPSEMRWVGTYWAYGLAIVASIPINVYAMRGMPTDPKELWETGFGAVKGNNLLNFETSLLGGVLLANTPQALLSYMYLAFNALYTTMFVSAEWSRFVVQRKTLRVTAPVGQQRATYWLGVPFRFAIPMTVLSGLFHWLASQSLFKVQLSLTEMHTREATKEISTCGYSPVAIILTTIVATVLAGGGMLIGRFRFPPGMPLASSNSAAISAACHRPAEDVDASVLPVKWGAITHGGLSN
ncbi:carboxypeptidase s1 [Stemphylium lycopersici]|uniref:Carboxypeptidase s1 n=1 Tax=Stemphylium lycopersici TaxID=183478 RepID=A0A364N8I1_STELY|nr:carboxypeptidase s1 [Stemphylium lycopersici]